MYETQRCVTNKSTDEKGSAEYDRFDHRPTVLMPRDSMKADDKLYVMENTLWFN